MIVVDTKVLASLYLRTEHSKWAERVLVEDADWVAPILWRSEMCSVLSQCVRGGRFGLEHATEVMEAAHRQLEGREYEPPGSRVLELSVASGCSAYDCEFVALAEDLGLKMVTLDRQVLRAFPAISLSPRQFVS